MTIEILEVNGSNNRFKGMSVMTLIISGNSNEFENVVYVNKIDTGLDNIVQSIEKSSEELKQELELQ